LITLAIRKALVIQSVIINVLIIENH